MIASYWTHPRTLTLWQLSLSVFAYVISLYLFLVARFAEVMRPEAEPPRGLAAVPALVHDEVGTVLGAACHTDLHTVLLAEAADIVLRLSLVGLFLHFLSFLYFCYFEKGDRSFVYLKSTRKPFF